MKVTYCVNGKTMTRDEYLQHGNQNGIEEICRTGCFPGLNTDDEFMAGRGTLADQLGDQTEKVVKAAQKYGYTPGYNDVYLSSAARFPGDPEAFVKHDSARGTLKRTLEDRGWACDGMVKVKGRQSDPEENAKPLGDDIVRDEVVKLQKKDPKAKQASRKELTQEIVKNHGA